MNDFIRGQSPRGPYVALHLRNGADWARACNLVEGSPLMFAAAQCLGYHKEHGSATKAMCTPSKDDIVRHARRAVKSTNATWIYVASDRLVYFSRPLLTPTPLRTYNVHSP